MIDCIVLLQGEPGDEGQGGLDGLPGAPGIPGRVGEKVTFFFVFLYNKNMNQGEPGDSTGIGGIVPGPRGDPGLPGRPGVPVSIDEREIFLKILNFYLS